MSKVARSARVASRQRTEQVGADKTLNPAETGELLELTAKALTITLPTAQDGAYFRIMVGSKHTLHTAATLLTIATDGDTMEGSVSIQKNGTAPIVIHSTATSHTKVAITSSTASSSDKIFPGSYIECWSDGVHWFVNGALYVGGDTTGAFAA